MTSITTAAEPTPGKPYTLAGETLTIRTRTLKLDHELGDEIEARIRAYDAINSRRLRASLDLDAVNEGPATDELLGRINDAGVDLRTATLKAAETDLVIVLKIAEREGGKKPTEAWLRDHASADDLERIVDIFLGLVEPDPTPAPEAAA